MHKSASAVRYSHPPHLARRAAGVALLAGIVFGCARAQPPSQLRGAVQTNADDRALARLVELAWATFDELDPIARDESGGRGNGPVWPPLTPSAIQQARSRLTPIQAQLKRIHPEALSRPWKATRTLLARRLAYTPEPLDALAVQGLVGRGIWASLGPEAW
ncbi:MAG: hypothetical protein AAFN74_25675, partial [Myxococcota bacterium]